MPRPVEIEQSLELGLKALPEQKTDFEPSREVLYSLREANAAKWRPYPELNRPVFP